MPNATNNSSISAGGISIQRAVVRTGSGLIGLEETISAAKTGTLSTRTTDTAGTLTLESGHGITNGEVIDIFWSGGVAYGATVGTVSGTSVPFTGASGDVLPSATTAITTMVQTSANISIDGDNCNILAIVMETNDTSLTTAGHVQFQDSGAAEIAEIDLVANVPQVWDITGGSANPFTGNPITVGKLSHAGTSSSESYKLKIIGVQDATP